MQRLTHHNPELDERKALYRTRDWQRLRYRFLRDHPTCVGCRGEATIVDHVLGHQGDWRARFWVGPFQPMCQSCHSRKTVKEQPKVEHVPLWRRPWRRGR